MKKCLLIGGAGFIGSNLAKCFSENGLEVTVFDIVEMPDWIDKKYPIKFVKGNYFSDQIDDKLLKGQDIVVLLACSVGPKSSMDHPESCYGNDIVKMIELLEQMKINDVCRLFFISSGGTIYGDCKAEIISEDMPTFPINHYGIMKLTQEKVVLMYNQLYNMNNVIFRLANPYGPGQRDSTGIGAVTKFMKDILKNEVIHIYGQGDVIRDYIFIEDVAKIVCTFAKKANAKEALPIYNVGTGQGTSLIEIVRKIEKVTGRRAVIHFQKEREIDVKRNVLDMNKLLNVAGDYKCISIEEGIRRYYIWLMNEGIE